MNELTKAARIGRGVAALTVLAMTLFMIGCPPPGPAGDGDAGTDDSSSGDTGDGASNDADDNDGGDPSPAAGTVDADGNYSISETAIAAAYDLPLTGTQERVTEDELDAVIAADTDLAAIVNWAKTDHDAGALKLAAYLEDQDGANLYLAAYDNLGFGDDVVVVRHCDDGDCVSAVQTILDTDAELQWSTPAGDVQPRSLATPYLLRVLDEADPDGTAEGAPVPADLQKLPAKPMLTWERIPAEKSIVSGRSADGNREIRVLSTFGSYWGTNYADFVTNMKTEAFDAGSVTYHAGRSDFDSGLDELDADDALIIHGHGDSSASQGRVVGMSSNSYYWWGEHYSEDRIRQRLDSNSSGGPGIIIFGGCSTSGMIGKLDQPNRILLGLSDSIMDGHVKPVVRLFFQKFAKEGLTLGEALDAVNSTFDRQGWVVQVNSRADLRITYDQLGDFNRAGCRDTCEFANDGTCDDGGSGSESNLCESGTDCSDCGPRHDTNDTGGKGTVTSTFDLGKESWRVVGDAEGGRGVPDYNTGGGQDGPYVSADDDVQGGTWYWLAPAAYHGDFSNAYGQTLTFYLQQSSLNSQFDNDDVVLANGDLTLVYDLPSNPGTNWTLYTVPLSEAGWTEQGAPVSEAIMRAVLSNITELRIRGEYVSGADTGGLDTVTLNVAP